MVVADIQHMHPRHAVRNPDKDLALPVYVVDMVEYQRKKETEQSQRNGILQRKPTSKEVNVKTKTEVRA